MPRTLRPDRQIPMLIYDLAANSKVRRSVVQMPASYLEVVVREAVQSSHSSFIIPQSSLFGRLVPLKNADLPEDRENWIVMHVHDPLLQRNDRIIRDLDVLGAHDRTALRDVAVADVVLVLQIGPAIL